MKNYILLLFIPIVCFGQTYEDIVSIDSKEQFIRIGVENDYEVDLSDSRVVNLVLEPRKDENGNINAKAFGSYATFENNSLLTFQFYLKNLFQKLKYDEIFDFVKKNLKFSKVVKQYSCYTVDEKREIGFSIEDDWCFVMLFTNNQ